MTGRRRRPALLRRSIAAHNTVMPTGFFTHDLCGVYDQGRGNPETAARVEAIEDQMIASGLSRCVVPLPSSEATLEDVLRAHAAGYIASLKAASARLAAAAGGAVSARRAAQGAEMISEDTQVNALSFDAAMKSAGAAIEAVRQVCAGTLRNAFACIRPPGHHAGRDFGHGFCLINSVACAALHALDVIGLKRVAILDIDVHRADGTEDIVKGDPRIRLFSLYQEGAFPYGLPQASADNIINTPLAEGAEGGVVLARISREWLPKLLDFRPELILMSAGFDAHRDEKQALIKLTEFDYSYLTCEIMRVARAVCGGRIVSILEGGYNVRSLARSAVAHITTLARAARD